MDVVDDFRREDPAMAEDETLRLRRHFRRAVAASFVLFHRLPSPLRSYSTSFFSVGSRLS
jgi:hypothetical protein